MKKITFLIVLLAFFFSWYGTAQITSYPYSEDFETGAGGWVATNGANGTWALGAPTANVINSAASGTNAWATNLSGNYNASENSFVQSPVFDLSSLSAPSIQFSIWWNAEFSWDGLVLQSSIDSGTSWQNVGGAGDPNNWYNDTSIGGNPGGQQIGWTGRASSNDGSGGWVVARHALTGLAGQSNVIFRFAFGSDTTVQDNGVAFDLVSVFEVSCPEPSGLIVNSQTSSTANISWTPGGGETAWEVVVQPTGTGVPSGSGDPTTSNAPYIAIGLTPATSYEVYVRSSCGGEFSPWVGTVNFLTECESFTAPYTQGFENAGTIPICWSMSGGEIWRFSNTGAGNHIGNNGTITGTTATNGYFAWVDSSGTEAPAVLLSPLVDVSGLTTPALSFYEISNNEGNANSTLTVEVFDGAAWNIMGTYNTNTAGWELKTINLSGLTITGDVQARFTFSETVSGDFYDDIAIDDVTFDELPSCPAPSMLAAGNITSNGAQLSWTEAGNASSWNIEIVPAGTTPTGTPTATGVSNPYLASGLNAITDYDFYVQSDCGGDTSLWVGPSTFTTLCDIFIPDYLATFNTFLQDCWDQADSGNPTTGPGNFGTSSWVADGFANNGFNGANKINLWLAEKRDWLLSPQFDLTGGPFQVELDFAVMVFGSATTAGTLGSDDQVQLLITNDNGATWTSLNTWNNTTAVPAGGQHYVFNLSAYSGQIVQFAVWASEGTADDAADNDVSFDNFQVRNVPTCPEPSALTSTNLTLTSTEVGWTENGSSTLWNIEYGPAGFTPGTGTIVTDVTTNPYVLDGLTSDTLYDFYVQANCGDVDGLSSWTGPSSFYTGYCASLPTSNDGDGVTNVTIGVTDFPSFGDVTYENHTATPVNTFQGVETNVSITFATGFTYNVNIWIDFNDNLVFEPSEIVFQGETTNANPTIFDATFTMPADAAIGQHRMRIGSADFGQLPPDPCFSGSFGVTLDFTVNILVLDCVLPAADYTITPDCDSNQFYIDVNVTSLGDATSLEISNNFDTNTIQATTLDVYQAGPFAFGTNVKIFVTNEQNGNCVISSPTLSLLGCPPPNDECSGAINAVVNQGATCDATTPGTILAASLSNVPIGSCGGNPDDDVWFQFTALHEVELISLINITGGTGNLDHALYSGTCGSLTELYCSTETASVSTLLTVGSTYYVRVFSAGSVPETSSFELCIQQAPQNTICEQSANFCSNGSGGNIIGFPGVGPVACLGSTPNPSWNIIQIGDPGLVEIEISQYDGSGNGLDVDFVLWGPFDTDTDFCSLGLEVDCPTCPNNTLDPNFYPFGNIVDCSFDAAFIENLTIDNAQTGEIYVLLVTNYSDDSGTITISQTNSGAGAGSTVAEIQVDLGGDQAYCGVNSVVLTANSPFADTYEWYADGFVIDGETGPTLTVTETNTYTVIAYDSQCDASAQDEVTITLGLEPVANPAPDIVTCDDISGDGFEDFDLESQTATILGSQQATLFNVTYHLSQADAITNTGALSSPYTNVTNPQTIWVRVEDANAPSCIATTSFDLLITGATPTATSVDIELCDDASGDGFESFNLTAHDVNILNGQSATDFTVAYYATEADANAGTSPLTSPYTNISNPQTIWARVDNALAVDCYAVIDFDLVVNELPITTFATDFDYQVCPNATVPIIITAAPQNYTAADVSIVWYQDGGVISGQTGLTLPVLVGGTYTIEVTFNATGCTDSVSQEVIQLDNCIIPQGISPDGDGKNDTFDLSNFDVQRIEIFNRLGTLVYSKDNYTNEWYGQSNNGDELPVGTYFYTMIYEGGSKQMSAWVYINK